MTDALDLFQLTHLQSLLGQQVVNTYTYVCTLNTFGTAVNGAAQLEQLWRTRFLETDGMGFKCGSFIDDLITTSVRAQNLYNPLEYSEYLDGTPAGTSAAEPMPPYLCYSWRTPWLGPIIRRGFKRVAGLAEGYGTSGVMNAPTLANLAEFTAVLNESLSVSSGGDEMQFFPCVVKRVKYEVSPGKFAYRLPESVEEGVYDITQGWSLESTITTQNSRKPGYGA